MVYEIVISIAVIGGLLFAFVPKFRTTVQVLFGKANDKATTPLERQKNQYDHLLSAVNHQVTNVASAKAGSVQAEQDVADSIATLAKLEGQYTTYADKISPAAKTELANKIAAAERRVTTTKTMSEAAHQAADLALKALDNARGQLSDAADTIQSNEQKDAVTKVLASAAKVSEDLSGINSKLGKFNEANRQVDHDFIAAQERLKMSQGTSTDQELAAVAKQSEADAVMARLDAKRAAAANPPAAQ